MTTTKLHVMTAVAAFATLFWAGCGDDDDNPSPGSGGSGVTGGKSGATGGSTGSGGKASGGMSGTTGGTTGMGGEQPGTGGITSEGGSGGVPPVAEGGSGGGGGVPSEGEPCTTAHYDATAECYAACVPTKTTDSEQFLNRCSEAGAQCTKFTAALPKLGANGTLPPLP
ncbi:MAG: hypothetical protein ACOY0T_21700 [Myxococcota bacterium]